MERDDLKGSAIKQDVNYRMSVYRASPSDMAAQDEPATLRSIDFAYPAIHTVYGHRAHAEIILHHVFQDDVRIDLVLPVELGETESPVLTFLAKSAEPCGMFSSIAGTCAGLEAAHLIPQRSQLLRYDLAGCSETFVVLTPLLATQEQLNSMHAFPKPSFIGVPSGPSIKGVVLGGALPSNDFFSVWSKEEIKLRNILYKTLFALGILLVAFAFILMKRRIEQRVYTLLGTDPAEAAQTQEAWFNQVLKNPRIRFCLVLDHFFMYTAAIVIPWIALHMEHINERRGLPWEYHALFFLCILVHVAHELFWFSKLSPKATRKVGPCGVAKNATFGIFCMLDYYLTAACIALALLMGSHLAYASIVLFVVLNLVGQVGFYTLEIIANPYFFDNNDEVAMFFRPRCMEVLHSILNAHFADTGCLGEFEMRAELMTSAYALVKFILEDLSQCFINILFALFYGSFPIVRASIIVKFCLAVYGPCKTYAEITAWRSKAGQVLAMELT